MEGMPQPEQNPTPPQPEVAKDQLTLDLEKKEAFAEAWTNVAIENGYTQKEDDGKKKVFEKGDQVMTIFVSSVGGGFATFYYPEVPLIKPASISFTYNGDTSPENTKKLFQESQKKFNTRYNQIGFDEKDKELNSVIIKMGELEGYKVKKVNNGRFILSKGETIVTYQHMGHIGTAGERFILIESVKNGVTSTQALEWGRRTSEEVIREHIPQTSETEGDQKEA